MTSELEVKLTKFGAGRRLTGVSGGDDGSALEVTGLRSLAMGLVVFIEGPAGMALVSVRQVAALAGGNGSAVHLALAGQRPTHPVQGALVRSVCQVRLGNTPLLRGGQPPLLRSPHVCVSATLRGCIHFSHSCKHPTILIPT